MKKIVITFCFLLNSIICAQGIEIMSVKPEQDIIGVSRNTQIIVELNNSIDSLDFQVNSIFQIYGSNSGLVKGTVETDTINNKFIFTPLNSFFCGEIINAYFGPLGCPGDSVKVSYHWRFTIEITNQINANFDSLQRFDYPSFDAIAVDFNNDGAIDIVSATGRVIYNDGAGSFNSYEEIEELNGLKYLVDVNNDQILDIITSTADAANVFLGDSAGDYHFHQNIYSVGGLIIAKGDINGDGFIDLIAKDAWGWNGQNNLWSKLINDGSGKFIIDSSTTYLENYISEADLVDMDKDGDLDLVLLNTWPSDPSTQFAGAFIYYNNGTGVFESYAQVPFRIIIPPYFDNSISDLRQLFIVDYDLNGLNDITGFGSVEGGLIILQDVDGNFDGFEETMFGGAENFAFFTSGDIDGNNRLDLIVSNWQICIECGDSGEVRMENYLNFNPIDFWSDSSRNWSTLGNRSDVGVAVVPVAADVDNDGDLDIIHTGYPTTVTYNENLITSVKEQNALPTSFSLSQNYPNPFNSITKISYNLPSSGVVKLTVYNVLGEKIKLLVNNYQSSGNHTVSFDASIFPSGLYLYIIKFNGKQIVKKMIHLK